MIDDGAAFVAGGSGGLGSAVAVRLAIEGITVAVGFHSSEGQANAIVAKIRANGGTAAAVRVDLRIPASVDAALKIASAMGQGVSRVIYCAGTERHFDFFSEIDSEEWRHTLDGDVLTCINLAKSAIPYLRRSRGAFVATSTYQSARLEVCGALSSVPKAAIERIVGVIAREEGRYGIRANVVRAGWFDTGKASSALLASAAVRARKATEIPLGRLGRPEEFAEIVAFLSSSRASFITGAVVAADGGEGL